MLFLLALLSVVASSGILDSFWKKKKLQAKEYNNKTKQQFQKAQKNITWKELIGVFDKLSEKQKEQIRGAVVKGYAHPNWKLKGEFNEFRKKLLQIIVKKNSGKPLTRNETKLLSLAQALLIPKSQGQSAKYVPARSSWLLAIKYTPSTKMMWVRMIRSKKSYRFPNVPKIDYIALITCSGTMGTYWWKNYYWKYSTNPKWR